MKYYTRHIIRRGVQNWSKYLFYKKISQIVSLLHSSTLRGHKIVRHWSITVDYFSHIQLRLITLLRLYDLRSLRIKLLKTLEKCLFLEDRMCDSWFFGHNVFKKIINVFKSCVHACVHSCVCPCARTHVRMHNRTALRGYRSVVN